MQDFTDFDAIKKIDPQDTYGSTEQLAKQCQIAWQEAHLLSFTPFETEIKNIVFCGMGASMYGALVLKSLLRSDYPLPLEIISDYHIPSYVSKESLVVLTSYSGFTEEVLSCAHEAKAACAKMVVITKGGSLADFSKQYFLPAYIFTPKLNPAGIPRLGLGYTIFGLLAVLNKLSVIDLEEKEITDALARLQEKREELRRQSLRFYQNLIGKIPVIFAAEHLTGNAHIIRNQFNETSKTFASYFLIPDLNHHLMEGLQFPKDVPLTFVMLNSNNYEPVMKKRVELTRDVVKQNKYDMHVFETSGATFYDDVCESLIFGSYLTLFLALHYDQNPGVNPWVDYFKEKLAIEEKN